MEKIFEFTKRDLLLPKDWYIQGCQEMDAQKIRPSSSPAVRQEAMSALFDQEIALSEKLTQLTAEGQGATPDQMQQISVGYQRLLKQTMKVTSVSDATQLELVRTGRELSEALDRVQRLALEKDHLLALAAHDLRTPLSGICGLASIIVEGEGKDPADTVALASDIVLASQRLLKVIEDLLDLDRFETTIVQPDAEAHPILEVVRSLEERFRLDTDRKQIRFRLITPGKGSTVILDLNLFLRIADNLVSNAIKFSPRGGEVTVGMEMQENEMLVFSVKDTGPGISEQDQARLFRKFTRLSARPTDGEPSTGLGLALTKTIVEMMGGTIQCESVLGKGATFTVRLPSSPKH